ncbi:YtxH domain-containing protein [Lentilactobacillus kosonis]|uniref:YtxH domain-containing protein n=1 Tax=Lentilactobacillus kosonis TaxID=2810561 RepID=A0A401FLC3_9LACO|nr:YtxH domain-containing protein [Lentilactobacillus kosonis]GAY73170.1 hypothetical protein NBRC111893_1316 [Lentilactobacillus kosonis]
MGKKVTGGIFAGLLGAGIYAAYQRLDESNKKHLKQEIKNRADDLKDRAVDYAFYAEDAINDAREILSEQMKQSSQRAKTTMDSFKNAQSFDDSDNFDSDDPIDIVVDPEAVFDEDDDFEATATVLIYPDGTVTAF